MNASPFDRLRRRVARRDAALRVRHAAAGVSGIHQNRHPRAGGDPGTLLIAGGSRRIPACAGMTVEMMRAAFGASLLIHPRRKASRVPQPEMAEEARVSERSEFPRRAISGEERRAQMRSIGDVFSIPSWGPANAVLLGTSMCLALQAGFAVLHGSCHTVLPFAATKGSRAKRESFASASSSKRAGGIA